MKPMLTPEQIAAGLSEAQKSFLLAWEAPEDGKHKLVSITEADFEALATQPNPLIGVKPTALGFAVRAVLETTDA
jgi:hypothetical protein